MTRRKIDSIAHPSRGLSRKEAAKYVGASLKTFGQMVDDGRMPTPRVADGRLIWDADALDLALTNGYVARRSNQRHKITVKEIDIALAQCADLIGRFYDGDQAWPLFERLERERQMLIDQEARPEKLALARSRISPEKT